MKNVWLILILITIALTNVPAQNQKISEEFIHGSWLLQGGGQNKTPTWFFEWKFEYGKFSLSGYPMIKQEGSYRVIKSKSGKLTLELFDQKGDLGTKKSRLEVVIDQKNDKLTIKDKGPFKRVINKQGGY